MGTMTKSQTISITGNNVREVANCIWEQVGFIEKHYGIKLPTDKQKLRNDLGQMLLWGMTDEIKLQFYDSEKNERLKYGFVPNADPTAVHTPPGEFPRFEISPDWQVRLVVEHAANKSEAELREFYDSLGWSPCESLKRTGNGTTTPCGAFRSGDFSVGCDVYTDLPAKTNTWKER